MSEIHLQFLRWLANEYKFSNHPNSKYHYDNVMDSIERIENGQLPNDCKDDCPCKQMGM